MLCRSRAQPSGSFSFQLTPQIGSTALAVPHKARNGLGSSRGKQDHLDAAGKSAHGNPQCRAMARHTRKRFHAGLNHRGLQFVSRCRLEPSRCCRKVRHSPGARGQPRIGIDLDLNHLRLSAHGYPREQRRMPPGTRDNNRVRPRTDGRYPALCRSCSTSRRCTNVPVYRTARKQLERASQSPLQECT